jgi:orotate phosphoribosyltransferase
MTPSEAGRAELRRLLAERAFRWGDFVLASGRRSDHFFDAKQVTLEGRGLQLAATLLLRRCRELDVVAVAGDDGVGPEKQHGTRAKIAGPPARPGEPVLLVEDVATTGGSVLRALEILAPTGVRVVEAAVIVDREEGAAEALAAHGLPLFALYRRSEFSATATA